jgi:hypothetical protein
MSDDNIIAFPVKNKRFDLANIPVDPETIAEQIMMMKLAYFAEVSEQMLDDVLRSMSMLNLEDGRSETNPITQKDIILIKESIASGLCRIVGIEHPLHDIVEENLSLNEYDSEESGMSVTITGYTWASSEVKS